MNLFTHKNIQTLLMKSIFIIVPVLWCFYVEKAVNEQNKGPGGHNTSSFPLNKEKH